MTGSQAKLSDVSSAGGDSPERARVILVSDWESCAGGVDWTAYWVIGELFMAHTERGFSEALDVATAIVDAGSPVRTGSASSHVDCAVFAFSKSCSEAVRDAAALDVDAEHVVIPDALTLGASPDEIIDSIDTVRAVLSPERITVHAGRDTFTVPEDDAELYGFVEGLRLADRVGLAQQREAELRDIRRWTDIDMDGGRPGLGFEWSNGELVPASNYEHVCGMLRCVANGEISKSRAAEHLDTSPRTITRCIEERAARYGLDV